jgi:hypothetical protein
MLLPPLPNMMDAATSSGLLVVHLSASLLEVNLHTLKHRLVSHTWIHQCLAAVGDSSRSRIATTSRHI